MNRRSLTPSIGIPAQGVPATRRGGGGARREISSRIILVSGGNEYSGWALNISRGGLRVVIEERVELGQELEIRELDPDIAEGGPFKGRVVWVQDEPDGSVVGLEFVGPALPKFPERAPPSTSNIPTSTSSFPAAPKIPPPPPSVVPATTRSPSGSTAESKPREPKPSSEPKP